MPSELTWFKWEAYATWVSGFALLALIYYAGAELYMIDIVKYDLEKYEAVIDLVKSRYELNQPILIGTTSVENSEKISKLLFDFADLIICLPILPIHPVIANFIFFI